MPVVLPEAVWDRWLDPRPEPDADELAALAELLVPAPDDWFEAYPVSPRVNRVVDHDADLARPVGEAAS
jgi:putative SOS response-associated peptidase YedK